MTSQKQQANDRSKTSRGPLLDNFVSLVLGVCKLPELRKHGYGPLASRCCSQNSRGFEASRMEKPKQKSSDHSGNTAILHQIIVAVTVLHSCFFQLTLLDLHWRKHGPVVVASLEFSRYLRRGANAVHINFSLFLVVLCYCRLASALSMI